MVHDKDAIELGAPSTQPNQMADTQVRTAGGCPARLQDVARPAPVPGWQHPKGQRSKTDRGARLHRISHSSLAASSCALLSGCDVCEQLALLNGCLLEHCEQMVCQLQQAQELEGDCPADDCIMAQGKPLHAQSCSGIVGWVNVVSNAIEHSTVTCIAGNEPSCCEPSNQC